MLPIRTERLLLTGYDPLDGEALFDMLGDPEVVRFEPYDTLTLEQCREEAVRRVGDASFIAVRHGETERLLGNLYFQKGDFDTYELGYVFPRTSQGKGYATESARGLLDWAFTAGDARRVIALCNTLNTSSWKLLERLRFRREGYMLKTVWFKTDAHGEPIWHDTYQYGMLREEYEGHHAR